MKSVSFIIAAAALALATVVQPAFASDTSAGSLKAAHVTEAPAETAHVNKRVVSWRPCAVASSPHALAGHQEVTVAYASHGLIDAYAGQVVGNCVVDKGRQQYSFE